MRKPARSVLDSFALLAFLFREGASQHVADLFEWADTHAEQHLIYAVNWAEVRYMVERKTDPSKWSELRERLDRLPLEVVPADKRLAEQAAAFKTGGGVSLGDCFAAALAKAEGLPVYTGDREFMKLASEVDVAWL